MKKIKTTILYLAPLLFLSALLAWPLSSEIRIEASRMPMIAMEHSIVGFEKETFGNLPDFAQAGIFLAGAGIIGLVCINRKDN